MQNHLLFFISASPCLNFSTSYIEMYSFTSSFTFLFISFDSCLRAILRKHTIRKITNRTTETTPNMIQLARCVLDCWLSSLQPLGLGLMLSQIT